MRRVLVCCSVLTLVACGDDKDDGKPADGAADGASDGSSGDGANDGSAGDGASDGSSGDGANDGSSGDGASSDFDCTSLSSYYQTQCADHMGISDDVSSCPLIHDGLTEKPFVAQRKLAASVCADAAESCDDIFVCFADKQGLSAVTHTATVSGQAVSGDVTTPLGASNAWAMIGTKATGEAGDLLVLFTLAGKPWYFKLEEFAGRAKDDPFVVDMARPVKLENATDNLEITTGTVTVTSYAIDGAFDVRATAMDAANNLAIDIQVKGTFTPAQ